MDVVRKNIQNLNGKIDISSEEGKGTTMALKLPLTMAILDGIIVKIDEERFIIPTISIRETIHPEKKRITKVKGENEVINVRGDFIPIIMPDQLLELERNGRDINKSLVIVIENEGVKKGLLVDEILGQQQIVIKSLGERMKDIPGISGGAILGDGKISLILDVAGIFEMEGNN